MKKFVIAFAIAIVFFTAGLFFSAFAKQKQQSGFMLQHEKDIAKDEPAPHNGGGMSTAFSFFSSAANSKLVFRKRVLHKGAAIGYHLQQQEEIYYIESGTGEITINNQTFNVQPGDAVLTLAGSSHGLKQTGNDDLVVIIDYEKEQTN
ncbi:MAG: cupin domain-containing protein [Parafilimonas sp.]|nr:cupin domain-containing protein [Parafilimonas sp.]